MLQQGTGIRLEVRSAVCGEILPAARGEKTMDWDKLRVFHAAAEAGSFTHAGDALELSQSAISRQISGLEENLQVALFHRHARGLTLTEQGELLYRTARDVFAKLSMAEAMLIEGRDGPKGPLRVSTTVAFGAFWLAPHLKEFHELFPDVALVLSLDGGEADLRMRGADIAIRMSPPQQQDLVRRHLMTVRYHAFAAPEYLRRHGTPQRAEELDEHRIIVGETDMRSSGPGADWLLQLGVRPGRERRPVLRLDNVYGVYRAVQSGLGIGVLPSFMTEETFRLVRVLPELPAPTAEGYFVYPEELRRSRRIAIFRDFVVRKIAAARGQFGAAEQALASDGGPRTTALQSSRVTRSAEPVRNLEGITPLGMRAISA
jgi:DNA-binding transcriptional LysR family regulator